jgi:hypothetical protein
MDEYSPGDGKTLQGVFCEMDTDVEYLPWDELKDYQKDMWEKIAEEFCTRLFV